MSELAVSRSRIEDFPEVASSGGMLEVAQSRAAQEVQAAMIVAQRFPRDQSKAFTRIMTACKRRSLAERSTYVYPKGGQSVTGPSIRLAETLAREWGNIDFGIVELEQRDGESIVMSYAWDLETNTRSTKIFTVKHLRHTKKGDYKIDDPREIYEMTANQGSRRLRACILAIIPGDITEAALDECDKTLSVNGAEPLVDRVRKMLSAFSELGVAQEMIEKRLGHNVTAIVESEFASLRKIYTSIKDGFGAREEFFELLANGNSRLADVQAAKAAKPSGDVPPPPQPAATVPVPQNGAAVAGNAPSQGLQKCKKCGVLMAGGGCPNCGPIKADGATRTPTSVGDTSTTSPAPAADSDPPPPDGDPRSVHDIAQEFADNASNAEMLAMFAKAKGDALSNAKKNAGWKSGSAEDQDEPMKRAIVYCLRLAQLTK